MNFFDQRLRPTERLKSSPAIEAIFQSNTSVKAFPLLLVYRDVELQEGVPPAQMGFVASKRSFRRAHDRNFIKRRMRESYRYGKVPLYEWLHERGLGLQGMLIFTGRELPDQNLLDRTWLKLLKRLDSSFFNARLS